ncbi:hypothetical protein BGX30_012623 [Mortierella sp. GBA39]|nr:hypothetical protein BGX30_012623 [Mortierella sp. GBA39]
MATRSTVNTTRKTISPHMPPKGSTLRIPSSDSAHIQCRVHFRRRLGLRGAGTGSTHKLRVLDLGYEYRHINTYWKQYTVGGNEYRDNGGVIRNTLHLSLASGLDQLSTLKNLHLFEFEGADLLELELIAEHWPMLKVKRGLQKDRFG